VKYTLRKRPHCEAYLEKKNIHVNQRETHNYNFVLVKEYNDILLAKAKEHEISYYSLFCGILIKVIEENHEISDNTPILHSHAISLRKMVSRDNMGIISSFAGSVDSDIVIQKSKSILDYALNIQNDIHNSSDHPLGFPNGAFFQSYADFFYNIFSFLAPLLISENKDMRTHLLFSSNIGSLPTSSNKYKVIGITGGPNFNISSPLYNVYLSTYQGQGHFGIIYVKPYVSRERVENIVQRIIEKIKTI